MLLDGEIYDDDKKLKNTSNIIQSVFDLQRPLNISKFTPHIFKIADVAQHIQFNLQKG